MKSKIIMSDKLFSDIILEKIKPKRYDSPLLNKFILSIEYDATINSFVIILGDNEDINLIENKYSDDEICQFISRKIGRG